MELTLIGIGSGHPGHLTRDAEAAIAAADLFLIPHKGASKSDLADLRVALLDRLRPDAVTAFLDMPERDPDLPYLEGVDRWHDAIAALWAGAIAAHPGAARVALLVWGDPSLYDSTLRIAARLSPAPTVRVIPGLTSLQLLTAAHAVPLNSLGAPVVITTGRRLRDDGWPNGADRVAVMLDGGCAFQALPPESTRIWWGAYLGMAEQILDTGPLAEAGPRIVATRAEARDAHGWIMDTYLLARDAQSATRKPGET